jgi:hypothetical protein
MTLNEFASALVLIREYDLDASDILLMDMISKAEDDPRTTTVMHVIATAGAASRAKSHARIKALCKRGLLEKVDHPSGNLRFKQLKFGPAYLQLLKELRNL